jgi:hypothetical protein
LKDPHPSTRDLDVRSLVVVHCEDVPR